jgi:hypothetical protein
VDNGVADAGVGNGVPVGLRRSDQGLVVVPSYESDTGSQARNKFWPDITPRSHDDYTVDIIKPSVASTLAEPSVLVPTAV